MNFLVLGSERDEHAAHVLTKLQTRGHYCEFLDSTRFPQEIRVRFDPVSQAGSVNLPGCKPVEFADIDAIYWRTYVEPPMVALPDPEQVYIAQNDARAMFESLLKFLPVRWVNGWEAFALHQTKPAALARVAALGLPVPATLIGNDPDRIRQFVDQHEEVIFKPVQGGAHTEVLATLTAAHLATLTIAPVTLQERIIGTDIRVFLAGDRAAACAIHTEAVDFRDDPYPEFEPVELPAEMLDLCRQAATALHLSWTGIDLRRTADDEYFFLEANPSPMFLGFEHYTGLPLTEMLVELLEKGA